MSAGEEQAALVRAQSAALTNAGTKALAARGRADLRVKEEAEEWLKRGLEFLRQAQIHKVFVDSESFYEEEPPCDVSFFADPNNKQECAFTCFERGIQVNPHHPELQHWLGNLYNNGEGVMQNYALAATWWLKGSGTGVCPRPVLSWPSLRRWRGRPARLCRGRCLVSQGRRTGAFDSAIQPWHKLLLWRRRAAGRRYGH